MQIYILIKDDSPLSVNMGTISSLNLKFYHDLVETVLQKY
jgi:hypothetical protein